MSSFLDEMAAYLDSQHSDMVYNNASGRNVFVGKLPDTPADCVAILGIQGTSIGVSRDVKEMEFPRFQVIARAEEYEQAYLYMRIVREAFHGMIGVSLTTHRVLRCHAEQEAGPIGSDDQNRFEFSGNFNAQYHATS